MNKSIVVRVPNTNRSVLIRLPVSGLDRSLDDHEIIIVDQFREIAELRSEVALLKGAKRQLADLLTVLNEVASVAALYE